MNPQEEQLNRMEQKIDAIYNSVEQTRKYFLYTLIVTLVLFVVPLLIAVLALPTMLSTFSSMYSI